MPVSVQGPDGRDYQFPDGTTKDVAIAYFKKKGIGSASTASVTPVNASPIKPMLPAKQEKGFLSSLYENSPLSLPQSLYQAATHPGQALTGIANEIGRSGSQLRDAWNTPEPIKAADKTIYAIPFIGGALKDADEAAKRGNWRQGLGTGLGIIGSELLSGGLANMVPTRAKAGRIFQSVMEDAGPQPVNLTRSSEKLLRMSELSERGGGAMPAPAAKLLGRVEDGGRSPLTYGEARDFASNLSDLAANEKMGMNRQMRANLKQLSHTFNEDVGDAAAAAGRGSDYEKAMKMYSRAARLNNAADLVKKKALQAAGLGTAGAIGYELSKR